jgi:hypothetical protein
MSAKDKRYAKALMVRIAQKEAAERGKLTLWTVYDHPKDYPDGFIARMHEVVGGPTNRTHTGTLRELREIFRRAGLVCLARSADDEPQIVESWV